MNDIVISVIRKIEQDIPVLKGKIQPATVDESTNEPYAAYTMPLQTPIRTIHGICGYNTSFEIAVCHSKKSMVEKLANEIIHSVDGFESDSRKVYLESSSDDYFEGLNIHMKNIKFKIV